MNVEVTVDWDILPKITAVISLVVLVGAFIALLCGMEVAALWVGSGAMSGIGSSAFTAASVEGWGKRTYKIPPTGKTTSAITAPARSPAAFPPKENQCYVCGIIDPERKESFGTADHPECVTWLGGWKIPAWKIVNPYGGGLIHTMHGLKTAQEVREYCIQKLSSHLETGYLTATLGEGPDARILNISSTRKITAPKEDANCWKIVDSQTGDLLDTMPWKTTPEQILAYCNVRFSVRLVNGVVAHRPTRKGVEFLDVSDLVGIRTTPEPSYMVTELTRLNQTMQDLETAEQKLLKAIANRHNL